MMHLKENYGVRITMEKALAFLKVGDNAMTLEEGEDWIHNIWVGIAIQNIPVVKGFRCNECQYSAGMKRVMKNHFSKVHQGRRMVEHSMECKVQLVFKAKLHKYIQGGAT